MSFVFTPVVHRAIVRICGQERVAEVTEAVTLEMQRILDIRDSSKDKSKTIVSVQKTGASVRKTDITVGKVKNPSFPLGLSYLNQELASLALLGLAPKEIELPTKLKDWLEEKFPSDARKAELKKQEEQEALLKEEARLKEEAAKATQNA